MNFYENRPTRDALYYFGLICSIPHPSGHEQKLAEKIISYRNEYGPFQNYSDLLNVGGIGNTKLEIMLDYIIIE